MIKQTIDTNEVIFPFENDKFQAIYKNDDFQIASGKVKGDGNLISIGVRWCVSKISNGIKYRGFPYMQNGDNLTQCWLIIPNDLAICLLTNIKDREQKNDCKIEKDKIYEVLQTLIAQEQNRTKDSQ